MSFNCDFNIYSSLKVTASNKEIYRRFLNEIIRTYENVYNKEERRIDDKVLKVSTNSDDKVYISLMIGECLYISYNLDHCDYFLYFNSKISEYLTTLAESYIKNIHKIMKKYFSSRVHF
jgi:hypothetical protein